MMKKLLSITLVVVLAMTLVPTTMVKTAKGEDAAKKPDPNFHIYIAFGQDDMEGQGEIEAQDKTVNSRFKMMCTASNHSGAKEVGKWYDAIPPLAHGDGKLGVADYFGRKLVEELDPKIKVGIINVSVRGSSIILFQENVPESYMNQQAGWFKNIVNSYGGNVYNRIIAMAKKAQEDGVIKGIIMHQGSTDAGDGLWPSRVKFVYDHIIRDLNLGNDIPLLAGEANHKSVNSGMNRNVAKLPEQSNNFFVVSAESLDDLNPSTMSFTSQGYRDYGERYAEKMMVVLDDKLDPVDTVASISKEPTVNSRYDDGTEQPLLKNDGEAKGGTLHYGLGTQTQEPSTYSPNIPTKSELGTYYVWVKAVGDSTHSDSEAKVYTSKIVFPITFKVVGGAWDDGTTADKRVDLSRYDNEDLALVLKPEDIPGVGNKPKYGYLKSGSWDEEPPLDKVISGAKTYTYTYNVDPNPPTTKPSVKVPGKTIVKKAIKKKKSAKISIRLKKAKDAVGYQIAIYKNKKNAKKNKKAVKKQYTKKIKLVVKSKKFKKAKKLFVRARAYKLDGKKKVFGEWSKIKKVKLK